jgi:hypothetical protein
MDQYMFDNLINALKKDTSPEHQLYTIKITIGYAGAVTTSQVAYLMKFFYHDNDKLELAKMAHGYTIDRDHYGDIVGKEFSCHSTKPYLDEFIHRY